MFDDSGHVEIQEDVEAKASKLCSLLRDQTKQQKMGSPRVEARGKIRIKIKRRSKIREEKEKGKGQGKGNNNKQQVKEEPDSVQTISSQSTNVTSPSPGKPKGSWRASQQNWNPHQNLNGWVWKQKANAAWWKRAQQGRPNDNRGVGSGAYQANQWASWSRRRNQRQSFS